MRCAVSTIRYKYKIVDTAQRTVPRCQDNALDEYRDLDYEVNVKTTWQNLQWLNSTHNCQKTRSGDL